MHSKQNLPLILKQRSDCLAETFFIVILISHLSKMMKRRRSRNGAAKPMIPTSFSPEQVLGAGEESAVLQVITLQRQFSLADSLH
jgi:hypothetical protein